MRRLASSGSGVVRAAVVRAAVVRVAAVRMADARGEVRLRESFEVERERYATARDVCV